MTQPATAVATTRSNREALDIPREIITGADRFEHFLRIWTDKRAHILSPAIQITALAPSYGINVAVVYLDAEREAYHSNLFHKKADEVSPNKVGLMKFSQAAGADWVESVRTDRGTIPHCCGWHAMLAYRSFDGSIQRVPGNVNLDYRDGSSQIRNWTPAQIEQSRAKSRVKYEALGLWTRARALHAGGRANEAVADLRAAVDLARSVGDPALFFRAAAALLAIDGNDVLAAEARATTDRITAALPTEEMRRRFEAAEPVRLVHSVAR